MDCLRILDLLDSKMSFLARVDFLERKGGVENRREFAGKGLKSSRQVIFARALKSWLSLRGASISRPPK